MNVMLSIVVPTYNHEHYITKALESILAQVVDFEYEVLIGEDISTDNTRQVLKELEKKLPSRFQVLYREKNLGMHGNFRDLKERASGKYITTLEGDDYWTYEHKLQKQVDFLESHPEYIAVAHNTTVIDREGNEMPDIGYPECKESEYTLMHFRRHLFPGHTATVMYRNFHKQRLISTNLETVEGFAVDIPLNFLLVANGRVRCIQEAWSAYRLVQSGTTNFTSLFKDDDKFKTAKVRFYKSIYVYSLNELKTEESIKITAQLYFFNYFRQSVGRAPVCKFSAFLRDFMAGKYRISALLYILQRIASRPFKDKMNVELGAGFIRKK